MNRRLVALVLAVFTTTGCFSIIDNAIDRAAQRTGEKVGDAVGEKVGAAIVAEMSPMLMNYYLQFMFSFAFGSGGYAVGADYSEGQWTRWVSSDPEHEGDWFARAFLKKTEDGKEWWRIKFHDGKEGQEMTVEALFSPDRGQLLRMRRKFPEDQEAVEVPVEEGTYYTQPRPLTEDSLAGAKVGDESITVPAGTFDTAHHKYGDAGGGSHDWWLNETVPGGMVQYGRTGPQQSEPEGGSQDVDPNNYTMQLKEHGAGATTELGAY